MGDDLILSHDHVCHVGPLLVEVPGNVGTNQQTQVFRSHLIYLAELAHVFQMREEREEGLPGKIFDKNDPVTPFISTAPTCLLRQFWIKSV